MLTLDTRPVAAARVTDTSARAEAFSRLLRDDLERYYALAAAILGDVVEAQDAVHDAAVAAWQRFGDLRDESRFPAWFDRILVNGCRERLRVRRRRRIVDIALAAEDALPSGRDHAGAVADADAVERAVRVLDPDHVIVVMLRYEADLTIPQIAHRLGIPEGTVKSRLHHARRQMRTALGEEARL